MKTGDDMTVKKRLFWSNILMISVPVVSTALIGLLSIYIIWLLMLGGMGFGIEDQEDFEYICMTVSEIIEYDIKNDTNFSSAKSVLDNNQMTIYIIPTGIERERFLPRNKEREAVREKLGIPDGYTVLISVGRLAKEKNCEELLQAISKFRKERVILLFVGDGPCRGELEEQVRQLDLKNQVIFTGMVPPKEVGSYYHAGDLFVSASSSETQGLTYLEAISASLPLLCRQDTCLNGVLLDGVNG